MTLVELLYAMCFLLTLISSVEAAKHAHAHAGAYILSSIAGVLLGALWVVLFHKAVERVFLRGQESRTGLLLWIENAFGLLVIAVWIVLGGFAGTFAGGAITRALA